MHFRDLLGPLDRFRFLWWMIRGRNKPITLESPDWGIFAFRAQTSLANDYGTAYEIFVHEEYQNSLQNVGTVVDLGCNVGFASLYLSKLFSQAHIWAFEPHPENIRRAQLHFELNQLSGRAQLIPAAASNVDGKARLTDGGSSSRLRDSGTIEVEVKDVFRIFEQIGPIDFLKVDIEGGEYSILEDARFRTLVPRYVAMEWHNNDRHPDGGAFCRRLFEELGYEIIRFEPKPANGCGILHAQRPI